jgi:hypothetical protein
VIAANKVGKKEPAFFSFFIILFSNTNILQSVTLLK